jgi:hypothetical protein
MPSNQEYKGKGNKGRNYDEPGKTGTAGNQQDSDLASGPGDNAQRGDRGSRQSGGPGQGNQSQSDLGSGPGDNSQRGSRQGGNLNQNQQSGNRGSSQSGNLNRDDLDDSM